jgi:hypothetical protein
MNLWSIVRSVLPYISVGKLLNTVQLLQLQLLRLLVRYSCLLCESVY